MSLSKLARKIVDRLNLLYSSTDGELDTTVVERVMHELLKEGWRPPPKLKDEIHEAVVATHIPPTPVSVTVNYPCTTCKGEGRMPGGQRHNGELVTCPICLGSKATPTHMPLDQFVRLMAAELAKK